MLHNNIIKLHVIVFLLGFTAILGKLISVPAIELVWYRMLFAFNAIFIILLLKKQSLLLDNKTLFKTLGTGVLVAAHWIFFFHSIKVSNVSVALGCISSATLFTGILEPIFEKRRPSWLEVVTGLVIILAIYLIFQFETRYYWGIIFSLICALLASVFNVINRGLTANNNANTIGLWEMISGFAAVSAYIAITSGSSSYSLLLSKTDIIYLVILGVVCTAFAFVSTVEIMKKISAFNVVLAINLEPVYGILFAFFIFGDTEHMTTGFYIGALILLSSVFIYPWLKGKLNKR